MGRGRWGLVAGCLITTACIFYAARSYVPAHIPSLGNKEFERPWTKPAPPVWLSTVACRGARGGFIEDSRTEDLPHPVAELHSEQDLEGDVFAYPEPTYGSHDAVGMEKTWMTFNQRYGPYGFGEDSEDYSLTKPDWASVNWAQLQDQCLLAQSNRSYETELLQENAKPRFRLAHESNAVEPPSGRTGRQAIILRTWETFKYSDEDMWNVRSIITEAGLAGKGEYTVFLLVDVKREDGARVHEDDEYYRQVLEESVPREFWDIAVLFHESLQVSWYPKVKEYSPFWQIMQPLQLFGHFFPEFDHFWQFEMDTRFIGDAGKMLKAYHEFGKRQPYKQSRERASWSYIPQIHGTYEAFSAGIDKALKGGATVWGPLDTGISGFVPAGPKPPVSKPTDEDFQWLAGEDADLLLYTFTFDITRIESSADWPFVDWTSGFDRKLSRLAAFPAQARASRTLLEAIHVGQRDLGLRVHSEATLPTFALWHGLKIVQVPLPKYSFPERDVQELDWIYNGGAPTAFADGIANGPAPYRSGAVKWYARPRTFEWQSSLNDPLWMRWMNGIGKAGGSKRFEERALSTQGHIPDELPPFMREVDGEVYAPNFMLHPRKTNQNLPGTG